MAQQRKVTCIYHGNCLDGFTSAWIVYKALDPFVDELFFVEGSYDKPIDVESLRGREVFFADFSVKADKMREIAAVADSIIVLDHHASAERELQVVAEKTGNVQIIFDMKRSGAMLTWNYFYASTNPPELVEIVQDRDLWLFKNEHTKALTAYMFTLEQTFATWDTLLDDVKTGKAIDIGQVLLNAHNKDADAIINGCTREVTLAGHTVNLTNCLWMFASDIGHKTLGDNLFSITYFRDSTGTFKYSLRTNDKFDCSVLAETFGGGGHPNAAGFSSTLPVWTELTSEL